jgi:hypothetical protein
LDGVVDTPGVVQREVRTMTKKKQGAKPPKKEGTSNRPLKQSKKAAAQAAKSNGYTDLGALPVGSPFRRATDGSCGLLARRWASDGTGIYPKGQLVAEVHLTGGRNAFHSPAGDHVVEPISQEEWDRVQLAAPHPEPKRELAPAPEVKQEEVLKPLPVKVAAKKYPWCAHQGDAILDTPKAGVTLRLTESGGKFQLHLGEELVLGGTESECRQRAEEMLDLMISSVAPERGQEKEAVKTSVPASVQGAVAALKAAKPKKPSTGGNGSKRTSKEGGPFGCYAKHVVHYMIQHGYSVAEQRSALDHVGAGEIKDSTLVAWAAKIKAGQPLTPAPLTPEQIAQLEVAAGRTVTPPAPPEKKGKGSKKAPTAKDGANGKPAPKKGAGKNGKKPAPAVAE